MDADSGCDSTVIYASCECRMANLFHSFIGEDRKKQRVFGFILMAIAGVFLTLGNSLVQFIQMSNPSPKHISAFEVLTVRCAIQLVFSALFMIYGKVHIFGVWKKNLIPLLAMGLAEVWVIIFMYLSIERIPVGDATVIQFTTPIFTALLSLVCFKKGCRLFDAVCGVFSFLGVLFVAKPDLLFPHKAVVIHSQIHTNLTAVALNRTVPHITVNHYAPYAHFLEGSAFALGASFSLSVFLVLNKLNGMNLDVVLTVFYPSLIGVIIGPFAVLIAKERFLFAEIEGEFWGILVVVGFTSFIGLMFLGESLQFQDPGPAILIRNCDVVYAYILQYLLMHIRPSYSALIGTLFILSCSSLIVLNHSFNLDRKCCGDRCTGDDDSDVGETKFMLLKNQEEDEFEIEHEQIRKALPP